MIQGGRGGGDGSCPGGKSGRRSKVILHYAVGRGSGKGTFKQNVPPSFVKKTSNYKYKLLCVCHMIEVGGWVVFIMVPRTCQFSFLIMASREIQRQISAVWRFFIILKTCYCSFYHFFQSLSIKKGCLNPEKPYSKILASKMLELLESTEQLGVGPSVHPTEGRQSNKPGQGRRRSRPDAPLIHQAPEADRGRDCGRRSQLHT